MNFSQIAPLPHIKGLKLGETVGQGSFAFVKSASLEKEPQVIVAVKFIHLPTSKGQGMNDDDITREVVIHSKCSGHKNVLRVLDCDVSKDYLWIAMEMADGGDLFDKIEPDVGVDVEVAQFYYQQLVNAIGYLHEECGVAHRDVKPENVLLDRDGNLKLADFGLATQFLRKDGSKRLSRDQRGSPPYMAPEIIYCDGYYADGTDIWSIGVLVFVLLTGEPPWNLPSEEDDYFRHFIMGGGNLTDGPWVKINLVELNLLRKILQPDPERRASLKTLRQHPWYRNSVKFAGEDGMCSNPQLLARKLLCNLKVSLSDDEYMRSTQDPTALNPQHMFPATQPLGKELASLQHQSASSHATTFSQRAFTQNNHIGNAIIGKHNHQKIDGDNALALLQYQDNVDTSFSLHFNPNRFTKFFSVQNISEVLAQLELALQRSAIPVKKDLYHAYLDLVAVMGRDRVYPLSIDLRTRDRRGWILAGTICIQTLESGGELKVINFERKAGDPLEWRRVFKRITVLCRDIVYTE